VHGKSLIISAAIFHNKTRIVHLDFTKRWTLSFCRCTTGLCSVGLITCDCICYPSQEH